MGIAGAAITCASSQTDHFPPTRINFNSELVWLWNTTTGDIQGHITAALATAEA
jgi:hypothetical protein